MKFTTLLKTIGFGLLFSFGAQTSYLLAAAEVAAAEDATLDVSAAATPVEATTEATVEVAPEMPAAEATTEATAEAAPADDAAASTETDS